MAKRKARIGSRHPVRKLVSSVPTYWDTKAGAIAVIDGFLQREGMRLNESVVLNFQGDQGSVNIPILRDKEHGLVCVDCDCEVEIDNCISYSWHKMCSGRWEITCYVSL